MELLIGIVFLAGLAYFYLLHIFFWRTFRAVAPELYLKNSEFSPIKYVGGFQWIDYALTRKYKELDDPKLTKAGDLLCGVYLGSTGISGYLVLILCVGAFIGVIYVFLSNAL